MMRPKRANLTSRDMASNTNRRAPVKRTRIRRQANVLAQVQKWPEGYVESFAGVPDDFCRPAQGKAGKRSSSGKRLPR